MRAPKPQVGDPQTKSTADSCHEVSGIVVNTPDNTLTDVYNLRIMENDYIPQKEQEKQSARPSI